MTLYGKWAKQSEKKRERLAQKDRARRDLLIRSIAAATTCTFFSPMVASADVVSGDNAITTVNKQNNIYTVESHKHFGNSAVNWFSQFGLGANEIANLYFGTQADNSKLNLFNFVDSKIDVNGTVNAIQNNTIGGNLFFLSREGVAVGAGGVINAGSLTLLTPSEGYYEKFIKDGAWKMDADAFGAEQAKMAEMNIPLSPSGEIMVKGKVFAPNGIGMKAASVNIDSAAQLKTGNIDFTDLVNAGTTDNTVFDGSQNLTATMTDSGDIVLAAYSDVRNKKDEDFTQTILGITGAGNETADNNTIEASVTSKGTIEAAGDVSITATSANGQEFYAGKFDEPNEFGTNEAAAYQIAQSVAKVNVAEGTVSGQNVTIRADADNSYIDTDCLAKMIGINALGAVTVNMDAAYAVLGGKASVDIGAPAVIEAKNSVRTDSEGKAIDALSVTANSRVQGSVGSSTAMLKVANIKGTNVVPSAAVSYVEMDNEATVNIDGTLKSKGNTKIEANAETQMVAKAAAKTTTISGSESIADVAVVVANGDTRANVTIGEQAKMAEGNLVGDLDIGAVTRNQVHIEAEASGGNGAVGATAVNVTSYDSSADVVIGAAIEAEDISIVAGNSVSDNTITANNQMGSSAMMSKITEAAASSQTVNALTNSLLPAIVNKLPQKIQNAVNAPTTENFADEIGKAVSIGASVTVVEEMNKANLTVKHDASIVARGTTPGIHDGKVSLVANNNILDTKMSAVGTTNNNGKTSVDKAIVSAGVLVADMDNDANVIIEAQDTASHKVIDGGDIAVTASNTMQYNRVTKMVGELLWAVEKVEAAFGSSSEYQEKLAEMKALLKEADEKAAEDPDYLENTEFLDLAMQLGQAADTVRLDAEEMSTYFQMMDAIAIIDIFAKAASFADLNNYSNFTVNNTTGGKSFDQGGAKTAIAGNVNLASVSHTGNVLIGKNAVIDAKGKLDITAKGNAESVNVTGGLPGGTGGDVGLGGSFSLQRFDVEDVVMIAEGAQLLGSAVNVKAENDVMQVGVVTQSGISGSVGISGMVNLMMGDSNSLVFVDDEASVTARETTTGAVKEGVNDGSITLDALNDTTVTNVAGGFSMGSDVSVGVGLALTDYTVNNMAGIVDTDYNKDYTQIEETDETTSAVKRKNSVAQAMQAARAASGLTNQQSASLFGSTATDIDGTITANSLHANALTEGTINAVSVAGGIAVSDDSGEPGIFDKLGNWFNNTKLMKGIKNVEIWALGKVNTLDGKIGGTINDKFGSNVNNSLNSGTTDQGGGNNTVNQSGSATPSVSIAAAGSASVNMMDKNTGAVVDGANITLHKNTNAEDQGSSLSVSAKDEGFVGAWSGSAGISWKTTTKAEHKQTSVGMAGAVGVNLIEGAVQSTIADSTITDADTITNVASSDGATVAAGLGMTVVYSAGAQAGTPVSVAGTVSVNDVENRTYAHMDNDTVTGDTTVTTSAYSSDLQVTGGVNVSAVSGASGKFGSAVGGAVTVAELENEVEAGIHGGTYTNIKDMQVSSMIGTRQIGTALGVGVQAGSQKGFAFEGAAVYNELENEVNAVIDGATITAGKVDVIAKDTLASASEWKTYIEDRGLDADGKETKDNADSIEEVGTLDDDGSLIVSAAVAVAGSSGNAGVAGAAAIDEITNDRTASITGSNITADNVSVKADADSLLVGTAAGGGGSKNFGAVGSVGWHEVENEVTATVDSSTVTADSLDVLADNDALLINVAGQVSAGKNAFGATLAYQGIDNITGAYITGSVLHGGDNGIAVSAKGLNTGDIIGVGVGVSAAAETAAVNGTVAINRGANDTQAIIGKSGNTRSSVTDANKIEVEANDDTNLVGVAGGVGASKTAAVGGAVAYNDIGGSALTTEKAAQNVTAGLDDTDITTKADDTVITVGAHDDADVTTAAVGVGGSGKVAVQGASATSLINKNVSATMSNTNIDKEASGASRANVTVTADNTSDIDGSASVVAGSGTAAIGAGVTVNRIQQSASAILSGGKQNVNGIVVKSTSQPTIFSVGIGGSVGGTAGITGSVAVNILEDNSIAEIMGGADITAEGSVGVISENDQIISNYAGTLSGGGTAAVGASVGVNLLTGDSKASVSDATITAKGNTTHTVTTKSDVADDAIVDTVANENSVDSTKNLKNKRSTKTHKGLVVDSSATRDLRSFMLTAAGSGTASVEATVNVNSIEGSTIATVDHSTINKSGALANSDVTVRAHDYTNSTGLVGGAAGAMNAGIAPASDTNLLDRTVRASITDKTASGSNKMTINANDVSVSAESKQGISSFGVGAAGAIEGAAVGAVVSVTTMDGVTEAVVEDATITADTSSVKADHLSRTNAGNVSVGAAAIGAGVGAAIGVMTDDSQTRAAIKNSTISTTGDHTVEASNRTAVNSCFVSTGVGVVGGGVAGSVIVSNINNTVETTVEDSTLDGSDVTVKANNSIDIDADNVAVGAGAGGVGAGVAVNTIDSKTTVTADHATITANGDVTIGAEEERDIDHVIGGGAGGVGGINANVMVTNIGKKIDDTNMVIDGDVDVKDLIGFANDETLKNIGGLTKGLSQTEKEKANQAQGKAGFGTGDSLVSTTVSQTTITATDDVDIVTDVREAFKAENGTVAAGVGTILATVGALDLHHNVMTNVTDQTSVTADSIDVLATAGNMAGKDIHVTSWQGSVAAATIGAAVSDIDVDGNIAVNVSDATMSGNKVTLRGTDDTSMTAESFGVQGGAVAVGALVADAHNDSDVYVTAKNSKLNKDKANAATVIEAKKDNQVNAEIEGGAVGLVDGVGLSSTASDKGSANVTLDKNQIGGKKIEAKATAVPRVNAIVDNDAYGILAIQVSEATARAMTSTNLTISDGNELFADNVLLESAVGTGNETTAKADVVSVNGSAIAASGSTSEAEVEAQANVIVGNSTYKDTTKLTVVGATKTKAESDIENLNIGIGVATGNNAATSATDNTTSVYVLGNGTVGALTVKADSKADNDARAESDGGGILSADEAARAESYMDNDANVNVSGNWNVAGSVEIEAVQTDRSNVNADAVRGGAATFSGTTAKNDIKGDTSVALGGNITANDVKVLAKNDIQTGDAYTYAAEGDNYSAVNIQGNVATMTVTKQAGVAIDANVTTNKYQTYEALTEAELSNRSVVECGMVIGDGFAIADTTTTVTDNVTLGQGKTLVSKTGGTGSNITLAASDTLDITSTSEADIPAAAVSGAEAETDTKTTRNNTVTVSGSVQSMNDINLYAGKDASGKQASLTMDTSAEAYNKSAIPVAVPSLDHQLEQNNQVIVASGATGESVRHINIHANAGKESIREMTGRFAWYYGGTDQEVSYVGTSEGQEMKSKVSNNFAQLDGSLTTGTNKTQNVVISGIVAPPGNEVVSGGDSDYTITLNGETMEGAVVSTKDYGNMLFDRYQEVTALMNEYQGKYGESGSEQDLSAYLGYKAEQERILAQMDRAGLLVAVTDGNQTMYYPVKVAGNLIHVIELPDIVSSGGNITVNADNLYGSGALTAQGAPQINITNESSAYLKLNDLTIGEVGGELLYNGQSIADNDNEAIKKINRDQNKNVGFGTLETDDPTGHEATINVLSTNIGKLSITSASHNNSDIHAWTPIKTVEVSGSVSNMLGSVTITNEAGDIIIQGDTVGDGAGIEAKVVSLSATGAVAQGYTDGIVHIGGDPQSLYAGIANENQTAAKDVLDTNGLEKDKHGMLEDSFSDTEAKKQDGSWVVGGEVYINASDININGTIQSGFSKYQVTIDDNAIANINYNDDAKVAYINGQKVYKLNDGNRAVLRSDGTYMYEVQAYYDPRNDKIIVDDITPNGGKIYLTGRIASTGNGKIIALDGGANIDIVSTANKTLEIGKIDNDHVDGLIRITDLNKGTETEITSSTVKVTPIGGGTSTATDYNSGMKYEVKDDLRYNWTTGTETTEKKTYHKESTEDWWGLGGADVTEELENYEETNSPTDTTSGSGNKSQGAYIDVVDEITNLGGDEALGTGKYKDYYIIYDNDVKSNERSEVESWKSTSGFLGWYKTTHYRWTVTTGSSQTYQHSIKADHDIGIRFIKGEGQQSINIQGAQDVTLGGTIINTNNDSWLNVTSGSAITQESGATLVGNHLNMNAQTGIQGIDALAKSNDSVETLLKTTAGDIDAAINGDMAVSSVTTGQGNISLSATGDITSLNGSSIVSGDRIDLTSGGAVDLIVHGGQTPFVTDSMSASINATAKGNITLTQDDGDMRIGTIVSEQGDVTLTAKEGSFIDALTAEDTVDDSEATARIQKWRDLGLIEGEGAFTQKRQQDAQKYREGIANAYAYYAEQKTYYEQNPSEAKSETYQLLAEKFDGYASADDFLAAQTEGTVYHELTKTLTEKDYDWTEEQLLYAIHETVINKTGATHQDKKANITGKNITLSSPNGSVGINEDTVEIVKLKGLSADIDALRTLAGAENSDIQWYEGNDDPYVAEDGTTHYNVAVINSKVPLGIAASGNVSVDAKGDILLAGRETSAENASDTRYSTLTVDRIASQTGDVRIFGERALRGADNSALHIQGEDIILEGGEAGIGTAGSPIVLKAGGELTARSEGDLYIAQVGDDLAISAVYAAGDAVISSQQDIFSPEHDLGYINVRGDLTLNAGGDIGTEELGLWVLAGGKSVNATADNIYIDAQAEKGVADSTITLGNMTAEYAVEVMSDSRIETIGTITATGVSATSGYSVYLQSEKDITLTDGMIEGNAIGLVAEGHVIQSADHTINGEDVVVGAKDGIDLGGVNNIEGLYLDNEKGDIRVNNTGDLYLAAEENEGNITVTNTDGILALQSSLSAIGTGSNVVLDNTNGDIYLNDKNITADSDVTIQTHIQGDIMGTGTVTATTGTVTMQTDTGNIAVMSAVSGADVKISTQTGSIDIGNLTSTGEAAVNTADGNIDIENLTSTGDVSVGTAEGNIDIANLDADRDAIVEADTGDITVDTADVAGNADITTATGDITVDTADVEGNATIGTQTGSIDIGTLSGNNVGLTTETGDIEADDLTANGNAEIATDTGDITVDTADVAGDADITTAAGDITVDTADIAGTTNIATQVQGDIGINSLTSTGDVSVGTTTGDITINELVSEESATVQTVVGAINANRITADDLVTMTVAEEGDITSSDIVQSLNDSVSIYTAKGDVDLAAVYAKQDASVGAGDGDVTVYTIDGENVIFTVENSDKKLNADTVTTGERVDITSSKTNIDTIKQREDRDNMLVISAQSPDKDMPFEYLNINHIITKNGVMIPELYGDIVRMHVDAERFYLPKLRIGKVGYFSTNSTSVTLYGIAPWLDQSNIQLWHDSADLGKWTSLAFFAPKTIFTDAVYLNGDDWYDVYRQRMSGVDMMRLDLTRENSLYHLDAENLRSADVYAPFMRYLLIDDSHWQENLPPIADEDDIVVEGTI